MVIAVASGKGGTGKTTVAANLALAASVRLPVQFLDCDVEEPNAHLLLKPVIAERESVEIPVPRVDEARCTHCGSCADVCPQHAIAVFPNRVLVLAQLCHGCGACRLLCPQGAISEVGRPVGEVGVGNAEGVARPRAGGAERGNAGGLPDRIPPGGEEGGMPAGLAFAQGRLKVGEALAPPVVRAVRKKADRRRLVIVDVAPGTSCPVVEALKGADFCLLVTEPTPFGLHDLELMVEVLEKLGLPAAVVINRAVVGDAGVPAFCRRRRLPILMEIAQDRRIAESYARGIPLVQADPEWTDRFLVLLRRIQEVAPASVSRWERERCRSRATGVGPPR